MTTEKNPADARNADFERVFTGDRQIMVTHFYSVGKAEDDDRERFAVGYWTHDDVFITGVALYDSAAGRFGPVRYLCAIR